MKSSDSALRVVVADDHHFFREGLRGMLATDGMVVVGEATDGAGAVALARELVPEIVVIDLKMPKASGTDAVRQIVTANPDARVVVITVSADEADVLEALAAGACGYLLKDTRADELVGGIRLAAGGHTVLSNGVARTLVARVRKDNQAAEQATSDGPALTARELEVIRLIADGDRQRRDRPGAVDQQAHRQAVRDEHLREARGAQSRSSCGLCGARGAGLSARLGGRQEPYAAATGSIARIAASRSATPSFATPAEMWRRTVIGESESISPTSGGRQPRPEHPEDLRLPGRQLDLANAKRVCSCGRVVAKLLQHEPDERAGQRGLALEHAAQRGRKPIRARVLGQVADGSGTQRREQVIGAVGDGQHDHRRRRRCLSQLARPPLCRHRACRCRAGRHQGARAPRRSRPRRSRQPLRPRRSPRA